MVVNVQMPVLVTDDGVIRLNSPRLKLFRRSRVRPVKFTRVVTLDCDTPAAMCGSVARQCASIMHADYSRRSARPVVTKVRFIYT
jgi:hypothetical protein